MAFCICRWLMLTGANRSATDWSSDERTACNVRLSVLTSQCVRVKAKQRTIRAMSESDKPVSYGHWPSFLDILDEHMTLALMSFSNIATNKTVQFLFPPPLLRKMVTSPWIEKEEIYTDTLLICRFDSVTMRRRKKRKGFPEGVPWVKIYVNQVGAAFAPLMKGVGPGITFRLHFSLLIWYSLDRLIERQTERKKEKERKR